MLVIPVCKKTQNRKPNVKVTSKRVLEKKNIVNF